MGNTTKHISNFDIAIALIEEAQEQKRRLDEYKKDCEAIHSKPEPNRDWVAFYRRWPSSPNRTLIRDNLKMARRLLKKEYDR